MSPLKEQLVQTIESLTEEEALRLLDYAHRLRRGAELAHLRAVLGDDPAFELPAAEGTGFHRVEPVECSGVPASKLLVSDRR